MRNRWSISLRNLATFTVVVMGTYLLISGVGGVGPKHCRPHGPRVLRTGNRRRLARSAAARRASATSSGATWRGPQRPRGHGLGAALAAVEPIESGRKRKQRRRSAPTLRGGVERAARVFV